MITEFLISGGLLYGYRKLEKNKFTRVFNEINAAKNWGYNVITVTEQEAGFNLIVSLNGNGFEKLSEGKDCLQSGYGHLLEINQNENLKTATVEIITEPLNDSIKFKPVKLSKPYEFYCGQSYMRRKLIANLFDFPHPLISGQPGCGKTEFIRLCLTNQIYNFSDRDLNIYFSDLSDVNDFYLFQNLKQTKGYAKDIKESQLLFDFLIHTYSKRLSIFESRGCKNIIEYNQKFYNNRMPVIFVVCDEFADYFPENEHEEDHKEKIKCYSAIKNLARKGRKTGIFLIIGIQRPDTKVLDASLRSLFCTKIGFSQNTDSSSLVVCDNLDLTNIERRKALFMVGNERIWFRSLYINDSIIKDYIAASRVNMHDRKDYNNFLPKPEYKLSAEVNTSKKANRRVKIDNQKG